MAQKYVAIERAMVSAVKADLVDDVVTLTIKTRLSELPRAERADLVTIAGAEMSVAVTITTYQGGLDLPVDPPVAAPVAEPVAAEDGQAADLGTVVVTAEGVKFEKWEELGAPAAQLAIAAPSEN